MTGRSNAIHKADVKVGSTYAVKVSGRVVPVTVKQVSQYGGWDGLNHQTGKTVRIRSAAKLRYELTRGTIGSIAAGNQREGWVRKDSPIVFVLECLVIPPAATLPDNAYIDEAPMGVCHCGTDLSQHKLKSHSPVEAVQRRVLRDFTRDELAALCGEDAAEQCQEFEDESGRWHRV